MGKVHIGAQTRIVKGAHVTWPAQGLFGLCVGLRRTVVTLGAGVARELAHDGGYGYLAPAQGVDLVLFFSGQMCVVQSAFVCDWLVNKKASYALLAQPFAVAALRT